ncbi:MAG: hypothetical protein A4E62_02259 [Syntrophorhabdus sp. PtaU1.Bin002]|nr:MAG: hypothetical protein A4E58_00544 [Syntrophorhabdus sp. PtaB.Bin006]OPY67504.1 MAG: hypothetical protein A4E62_02259 [Syntrophorhabdus sp. PtaU1.Bin002]
MLEKSSSCASKPSIPRVARVNLASFPFFGAGSKGCLCDEQIRENIELPSRPYRVSDGKGKFAENIPYQIVSLLQRQIEIKPATHQYSDDLAYFLRFNHTDYRKQFSYQPIADAHLDQSKR